MTGAYEGWYRNKDGSVSVLVGYFNRNTKQELDIPIGPNNRIEPGGPDRGQPTHFLTGRQWGVFTFKAPADFADQKLTWTLVANGQTNTITLHMRPEWIVEPLEDVASKNTPPVVRLQPNGPAFTGPPSGIAATYTTTVSSPLPLTAWLTDEPPKLNVATALLTVPRGPGAEAGRVVTAGYRSSTCVGELEPVQGAGPGSPGSPGSIVTFDPARPAIDRTDGKATTMATFSVPGEYVLRLQANDQSGDGGGGFQCCWTNVHVGVSVKPASAGVSREVAPGSTSWAEGDADLLGRHLGVHARQWAVGPGARKRRAKSVSDRRELGAASCRSDVGLDQCRRRCQGRQSHLGR